MIINKIKTVSVVVAALVVLSGCGGSSDDPAGNVVTPLPTLSVPVAEATVENATEAVKTVFEAEGVSTVGTTGLLAAGSTQTSGFDSVKFALNALETIQETNSGVYALNEAISDSQACTGGGNITVSGTVTQTAATVTMVTNNCVEDGVTLNGTIGATLTLSSAGQVSYAKLTFETDYTVTDTVSSKIHQGSYMELSLNSPTAGTSTSSLWFESLGQHMRYDDLKINFTEDGFGNGTQCYKNGRIYINNLTSYMDIDSSYDPNCLTPFTTSGHVLTSGSTRLLGSNGLTVHVEVTGPNTLLATDQNGNTLSSTN